jgi:hypothetical protein
MHKRNLKKYYLQYLLLRFYDSANPYSVYNFVNKSFTVIGIKLILSCYIKTKGQVQLAVKYWWNRMLSGFQQYRIFI